MNQYARLVIAVDSRQTRSADRDLQNLERTAARAEETAGQLSAALGQLGVAFRGLAGPLATILGGRQVAQAAEDYAILTSRLNLVTDGTEELIAAQEDVFRIAQQSRQPLNATAELYQRIATNADALQLSGAGVSAVVDTINKTLAISGTSGASASAALVQLGQAFASGTLRGEELNSVLEQAPALARALADGLGVSVGELRTLGQEGVLTSEMVVQALLKQADSVDEQFRRTRATGGQMLTVLGNSLMRTVGELDAAIGASSAFAGTILSISNYLDSGAFTDGILDAMAIWRLTIEDTISDLDDLGFSLDGLGDKGDWSVSRIVDAFRNLPVNVKTFVRIMVTEAMSAFDRVTAYANSAKEQLAAIFTSDTIEAAQARLKSRLEEIGRVREDLIAKALQERDALLQTAQAESDRRSEERKSREASASARQEEIEALRAAAKGRTNLIDASDKERQAVLKFNAALEDQIAARRNAMMIEVASIGMGDRLREEMEAINKVQQEYARRREELARAQGTKDALGEDAYQERINALRRAESEEIQIIENGARRKLEAQREWTNGARRAWENYLDSAADVAGQTEQLFSNAFSRMEDVVVRFATTGKLSFREFAMSVLEDMARIQARQAISGLANIGMSAIGGMFGGMFGATPGSRIQDYTGADFARWVATQQAKGGAWHGGVQFFAKGGAFTNSIVHEPTLFPMATGMGLMGEAGPEAIMPLTRTSDGSLGVRAVGSGSTAISINIPIQIVEAQPPQEGAQFDQEAFRRGLESDMKSLIDQRIAMSWRPGGASWRQANGR